ncbi:hypothetical protein FB107DRAFT_245536 [Schizophyllum commune]
MPSTQPTLKKHPRFYLDPRTVELLLDDGTLYRVFRYSLETHSPAFATQYLADGTDEGPIRLPGVSSVDLDRFLSLIYPVEIATPILTTAAEWTSVLRLAHKWSFLALRQRAIREVYALGSVVDKIAVAREFGDLDSNGCGGLTELQDWLLPAFVEACTTKRWLDSVSEEDAERLGAGTVLKIARIREANRKAGPKDLAYDVEGGIVDAGLAPAPSASSSRADVRPPVPSPFRTSIRTPPVGTPLLPVARVASTEAVEQKAIGTAEQRVIGTAEQRVIGTAVKTSPGPRTRDEGKMQVPDNGIAKAYDDGNAEAHENGIAKAPDNGNAEAHDNGNAEAHDDAETVVPINPRTRAINDARQALLTGVWGGALEREINDAAKQLEDASTEALDDASATTFDDAGTKALDDANVKAPTVATAATTNPVVAETTNPVTAEAKVPVVAEAKGPDVADVKTLKVKGPNTKIMRNKLKKERERLAREAREEEKAREAREEEKAREAREQAKAMIEEAKEREEAERRAWDYLLQIS